MRAIPSTFIDIPTFLLGEAQYLASEMNEWVANNLCDDMEDNCGAPQIGMMGTRLVIPDDVREDVLHGVQSALQVSTEMRNLIVTDLRR